MEFKSNRPIYRQIVDYCLDRILTGEWGADEHIPSVRELSVRMSVNSRTVLKAYEYLQSHGIIYPVRGMGYNVSDNAVETVDLIRREQFISERLPELYQEMKMLNLSIADLAEALKTLQDQERNDIRK